MNFLEYAGKQVLQNAGIRIPAGYVTNSAEQAAQVARQIGPCVVKAQVPTGKRGKAGGIRLAKDPAEARRHATEILGMTIGGHKVESVLIDPQVRITREMYAAVLNDPASKSPLLLFAADGGMDIEELAATRPGSLIRIAIDIRKGLSAAMLDEALPRTLPVERSKLVAVLRKLYAAYAASDAELLEINPLVVTGKGDLLALDCKYILDDSAIPRREELARSGSPDRLTWAAARGRAGSPPRPTACYGSRSTATANSPNSIPPR